MRYTKKDLFLRFINTYLAYLISFVIFIVGLLVIINGGLTVWFGVGLALVVGSITSIFSAYQNISRQKMVSENYLMDEVLALFKKVDAVLVETIKISKTKEFDAKKKQELLVKLSYYINTFLNQIAKLNAKSLINATFMDHKLLNYFSIVKIKIEKELREYQKNNSYVINWDNIFNLFVYEKVVDKTDNNPLEYLNGIENDTIDKLKISFWTCLNVNKFSEYNNIGDYFYHDVMGNVYYYSKILRDIAIQKNNNVCDFLRLIKNTNYVNEDPENIVWKQNKGNIKNINVYDYAELVYQNIESFFNGKIENEKAIRILRNVKVQLSYSRNKKYLEFRKEAIDIVIEKLS